MNEHKGCKKTVLVVPLNHFDPSWRRCFDKKATLGNTSVASYAEIEGMVFDRWIGYGQTISEGQTAVLRKYIEKHPDKKEVLKKWRGRASLPVFVRGLRCRTPICRHRRALYVIF